MKKKVFIDFEGIKNANEDAILRAFGRSSLNQNQKEEFCSLLDEEMNYGKIKILTLEAEGPKEFILGQHDGEVRALIFTYQD
ncbi:hypothetical protein LB941_11240 [Ligilactobacillus sp. WILCCON 0076]|uniref:Uncharacterized protein n=1 Tax=Ligilactobacillus ubinensis TaxID=2876789 RepID=A0A9X2FMT3_9LACO|nr:hypothetical protein [Ligilactobacillus ubinensis]MCP0887904.1 hypothetical protein [Ligilactobacillus ubinensis]